jgi:hypothetical protein
MKSHMDFTNGYRINYPDDWQRQQLTPVVTGFFAPREGPADIFSENVNVAVGEAPGPLTQFVDAQVVQMQNSGGAVQLIGRTHSLVNGLPAEQIQFSGHMGPVLLRGQPEMVPMQWLQVYVQKNRRMYCLTYTAEPRAYELYMPQIQAMITSLELS